jgi:hypothetical protein
MTEVSRSEPPPERGSGAWGKRVVTVGGRAVGSLGLGSGPEGRRAALWVLDASLGLARTRSPTLGRAAALAVVGATQPRGAPKTSFSCKMGSVPDVQDQMPDDLNPWLDLATTRSPTPFGAVPWARRGFTAEFGMGSGGSRALWSPGRARSPLVHRALRLDPEPAAHPLPAARGGAKGGRAALES